MKSEYVTIKNIDNKFFYKHREVSLPSLLGALLIGKGPRETITVKITDIEYL